MSVMH